MAVHNPSGLTGFSVGGSRREDYNNYLMEQTLETIAQLLQGRIIGDGATLIRGVNSVESVQEGELTFAEDPGGWPRR